MRVLVLRGGPDRERAVSLNSGAAVAGALAAAGHEVIERDILPDDLSAFDETFDLVFPVLHGAWGEGGPLQEILESRGLRFVGSPSRAARTGMNKPATKAVARDRGIATPDGESIDAGQMPTMSPPLVIKPVDEGSSVAVYLCRDRAQVQQAVEALGGESRELMAERLIEGREMTVGIVGERALPVIEIRPAEQFYDYEAKYTRDDTNYSVDIDLPADLLAKMQADALKLHQAIGARHLSRVDFIVDRTGEAWLLEINTLPGFTDHSLVPMAGREMGWEMPELCDRLVQLAMSTAPCR